MRCALRVAPAVALACALPATVQAQGTGHWSDQCAGDPVSSFANTYCLRVVEAVEILQPRLGMAFTAGNPVQGTASTLGLRLGALPRIGVGLRATAVRTKLPPVESADATDELSFFVPALAVDATVGLFSGMSLAPTVGGFAAVDLLASVATVPIPEGEGFTGDKPFSWALGARVGILNESFTAPGVSVSAMYRTVGDVAYGDSTYAAEDAYFAYTEGSVLSARATVSKRLLMLGATAGVGWDRHSGKATARVRNPGPVGPSETALENADLTTDRITYFGNVSMTFVIVHLVGEVGWQEGGTSFARALDAELLEAGALYGGLAIRLTL